MHWSSCCFKRKYKHMNRSSIFHPWKIYQTRLKEKGKTFDPPHDLKWCCWIVCRFNNCGAQGGINFQVFLTNNLWNFSDKQETMTYAIIYTNLTLFTTDFTMPLLIISNSDKPVDQKKKIVTSQIVINKIMHLYHWRCLLVTTNSIHIIISATLTTL